MTKETKEEQEFTLGDDVLNRIVQIVQEGLIMGIDVTDLMRQIRVVQWPTDEQSVHLSKSYIEQVKEGHRKMVEKAQRLEAEMEESGGSGISILGLEDQDDAGPN